MGVSVVDTLGLSETVWVCADHKAALHDRSSRHMRKWRSR